MSEIEEAAAAAAAKLMLICNECCALCLENRFSPRLARYGYPARHFSRHGGRTKLDTTALFHVFHLIDTTHTLRMAPRLKTLHLWTAYMQFRHLIT